MQHCAIRTVNLDAQVGWLSQFVPTPAMYIHHFCQQQCANYLPLVMGNTLRVNPIIPSTPSPFNTPQTAISKNNPDFSAFSFSRCVFHTSPSPSCRTILFFLSYPPIHLLVFIHFITPVSGNFSFCVLNLYESREGSTKYYNLFFVYLFIYL